MNAIEPPRTAALDLPLLAPAQAAKHITHNEALIVLERAAQMRVSREPSDTPPDTQSDGFDPARLYRVGPNPTGEWAGHPGTLAAFGLGVWRFIAPQPGFLAVDEDLRTVVFDGVDWQAVGAGPGAGPDAGPVQETARLGINASADDTNRLSVAADATLLSHDGGSHRVIVNRAEGSETASVVFQTGFSGQAEFGLLSDTRFALKSSADGAQFTERLSIDTHSGEVSVGGTRAHAKLSVNGNLSVRQSFAAGAAATPTVTDFVASGDAGTAHTLTRFFTYSPVSWQGNYFNAYRARGLETAPAPVASNDTLYSIGTYGHDGAGFRLAARMAFQVDGTPENGQVGAKFVLGLSDGKTYSAASGHGRVLTIGADRKVQTFGRLALGDTLGLASFAVAELPSASPSGQMAYCRDAAGGAVPVFSDGAAWRRLSDRSVVD